ncbi:FAD synthetase [Marchantia polymorpha subsp. ruderalis]|uniref:FAD synthase n=2 Tax=Marchantia polymorpha TaxID=3197 RepID=A0A176VID3_MARPO|nr:hypothetical protein AXG93_154s1920 [Marchantia polymorpha subsp. ruderalis]PTQ44686.1 hypothetical protein MARPO_0019s0104 [Marchantia polymorpha]BBM98416.1 hypothetical protein Mp_1g13340 [Marchantia polymorpha subsp. ruderalis]|eukprot:PTQ44686.1 hypothetical protein MARPO_0019s0104 [Marchantia polymorpha]
MAMAKAALMPAVCMPGSSSSSCSSWGVVVVLNSWVSFSGRNSLASTKSSRLQASRQHHAASVEPFHASLSSGGDEFSSTSSALSSRSFECSVLKEGHRANRWKRRSLLVRAEVSEETQKFRPRSIREEKEDIPISTEFIAKPGTYVPIPDIRGGVVALGKFDALHIGHRALAEQAARMGSPVLLSFAGMGEVLGWQPRLPVAAVCDRRRIMSIWAKRCGGVIPKEHALDFTKVRSLSPEEFVKKLATELHVSGVVAGANYRFGYKAAGDASDLVHLCNDYGLQAFIVDPVMDTFDADVQKDDMSGTSREKGQVSSTRVRRALAKGDLERVASLLGRKHRLVLSLENCRQERDVLTIPLKNALNQAPREGCYDCTLVRTGDPTETLSASGQLDIGDELIGIGHVKIGTDDIQIRLLDNVEQVLQRTRLGLEFP